jgi:uncharacterized protein (TIGR02145 family)
MKKLFTLLALIATTAIFAQAPQGFNYQATVRNSSGALLVNQNVYFKFNVMLNSSTSVPVFSETQYVPTDDLGQVNLVIGSGTATTGTFSTINWGTGNYYLGIELNTGSGYVAMGTTQLLSVPYALYANSAGIANTSTMMVSPTVTTGAISNLTMFNATLSATITNANLNQINEKGFAYSISPNPRRSNGAAGSELTSYSVGVSDPFEYTIDLNVPFLPNTTYYVRAYVVTENEVVVYGNQVSFTTLSLYQNGNGAADIDGNQYPSILLNGNEWMQNNLNVSKYRNGDSIPEVTDATEWSNLTTGAWRYIANDPAYGKLYNWYAVNDPRGLAPQGWHVSTDSEINSLITFLGGNDVAGGRMKGGSWGYTDVSGAPCNSNTFSFQYYEISGFKALGGNQVSDIGVTQCAYDCYTPPVFMGYNNGIPYYSPSNYFCLSQTGSSGNWWSATEVDSTTANHIGLTIDSTSVTAAASDKKFGYSVRCVKD